MIVIIIGMMTRKMLMMMFHEYDEQNLFRVLNKSCHDDDCFGKFFIFPSWLDVIEFLLRGY